jgi:hypothetical protein
MFEVSELGCLLEPGPTTIKQNLEKSKSGFTDRARSGNAGAVYAEAGTLEAGG